MAQEPSLKSKETVELIISDPLVYNTTEKNLVRGGMIGAVDIVATHYDENAESWVYELENHRSIDKPAMCAGDRLTFWNADTPERIAAFNSVWEQLTK